MPFSVPPDPCRAFSATLVAGLAVLAFVAAHGPAMAQEAKDDSVLHKSLSDQDADGLQLGGFKMTPKIEFGTTYDDNIFRTKKDRKDDLLLTVSPGVALQTDDWYPVNFSIGAVGEIGRYVKYGNQDYEAFATNANMSADISDDWSWDIGGNVGRSLLRRGLDTDNVSNKQLTYWYYEARSNLSYHGDPFAFRFTPVFRRYDFNNAGSVSYDDRDRDEYELNFRFAYRVGANTSVFIDPSYVWERYDRATDYYGYKRNSHGYDVRAGVGYDATELLYMEAGVGYFRRDYEDGRLKPSTGLSALARVYWNPLDVLSFEGEVRRGVTESDAFQGATSSNGAVSTGASLRAGWLAADNILVDSGLAWTNFDYNGVSRNDDIFQFDLGARYYMNRYLYTGLRYYHDWRNSSDNTLSYDDNRVMFMIGGQL